MKKQSTKEDILAIGTELIAIYGYNATGIESVLKKAGVPKGSFYHYFSSKEDFGLAIIDRFAEEYAQKLQHFLGNTNLPPLQRIRAYIDESIADLSGNSCSKGCLIGNLGQELADQNERFRARISDIFADWRQLFEHCIIEAKKTHPLCTDISAQDLAEYVLSGWEGALLRAKVMKSPEPLLVFSNILFSKVLV